MNKAEILTEEELRIKQMMMDEEGTSDAQEATHSELGQETTVIKPVTKTPHLPDIISENLSHRGALPSTVSSEKMKDFSSKAKVSSLLQKSKKLLDQASAMSIKLQSPKGTRVTGPSRTTGGFLSHAEPALENFRIINEAPRPLLAARSSKPLGFIQPKSRTGPVDPPNYVAPTTTFTSSSKIPPKPIVPLTIFQPDIQESSSVNESDVSKHIDEQEQSSETSIPVVHDELDAEVEKLMDSTIKALVEGGSRSFIPLNRMKTINSLPTSSDGPNPFLPADNVAVPEVLDVFMNKPDTSFKKNMSSLSKEILLEKELGAVNHSKVNDPNWTPWSILLQSRFPQKFLVSKLTKMQTAFTLAFIEEYNIAEKRILVGKEVQLGIPKEYEDLFCSEFEKAFLKDTMPLTDNPSEASIMEQQADTTVIKPRQDELHADTTIEIIGEGSVPRPQNEVFNWSIGSSFLKPTHQDEHMATESRTKVEEEMDQIESSPSSTGHQGSAQVIVESSPAPSTQKKNSAMFTFPKLPSFESVAKQKTSVSNAQDSRSTLSLAGPTSAGGIASNPSRLKRFHM